MDIISPLLFLCLLGLAIFFLFVTYSGSWSLVALLLSSIDIVHWNLNIGFNAPKPNKHAFKIPFEDIFKSNWLLKAKLYNKKKKKQTIFNLKNIKNN